MRAASCEQIKDYKAAALFIADAIRQAPNSSKLLFSAAIGPIGLITEGKLEEAWEYVTYQLQAIPHALTSINASLVRFHQASRAVSPEERRSFSAEQFHYLEDAWRQFQLLPHSLQVSEDIRDYIILCFEAAALAHLRSNQPEAAKELYDRIVTHIPGVQDPLTLRTLVTSPRSHTIEKDGEEYLNRLERTLSNVNRAREATVRELGFIAA
jgi:hypothetical protein